MCSIQTIIRLNLLIQPAVSLDGVMYGQVDFQLEHWIDSNSELYSE